MVVVEGDRSDGRSSWSWIWEISSFFFLEAPLCLIGTGWSKKKAVVPCGERRLYPSVVSRYKISSWNGIEPGHETMDPEV
jgi:hypothetical protein